MKAYKLFAILFLFSAFYSCREQEKPQTTVPFQLDHNRMIIDAKIKKADGQWRDIRIWVDSGNPEILITPELARDLGKDLSEADNDSTINSLYVSPLENVYIGDKKIDYNDIKTKVLLRAKWLFNTMYVDASLSSTILQKYHIVFDYPVREMTIADKGSLMPLGKASQAFINRETGIVQLDAQIGGEKYSFALDNGAAYSYTDENVFADLLKENNWPTTTGAVGCANIWGWWPGEINWPITRIPEITWGSEIFQGVGIAGLPPFFGQGQKLDEWYSQKTAKHVEGFFGPNLCKDYRIEIDYVNELVFFTKGTSDFFYDMDIIGLNLRPLNDGSYMAGGIKEIKGKPALEKIEVGDIIEKVDGKPLKGLTMGAAVDLLRGKPGELKFITYNRENEIQTVKAEVHRFLE